jgi:PKD repeat protein
LRIRRLISLAVSMAISVPVSLAFVAAPASAAVTGSTGKAITPGLAQVITDPAKRMPSEVPSKKTPWILDGEATKIVQVGDTMIVGGLFTTVADPMNGPQYARQNLFAFDKTTGLVSQTCNPTVDGQVQQLLPGPTPNTVYVAGDFTKINGKGPNHVQLLDVTTCTAVASFKAPSTNGGVETMEVLPNNRLFIGGFFTKIAGVAHGQLATLNATTGALDPYMNITVAGHHNTGTGAQAPVGPRESALTPAGDRLVVNGNFRTVGGLARDQLVMINLDDASASVSTTWATTLYTPICSPGAFDSYMRDVEMSPDGSYFVVAVTGGPHSGTLCDTATRWETYATGTTLTPTWTTSTGGDTLWGVGITGNAVYVGGHERWMNNPSGSDRAAQGAVPRPGLVALDPGNGLPLKWNPGRNPRGEAVYDIYPVSDGIYIVSDTDWVGDRRYQRPRVAFFPNDTGYNIASTQAGSLPGSVYVASPVNNTNVLYRVNAGGALVAATDGGPDWAVDTSAAPSPLHNTGSSTATQSALTAANLVNVPPTTPLGIWTSERNDPTGGNEMQWSFPVTVGTPTTVRLYFASRSSSTRRFTVNIDGVAKLTNYDPNVDPGVNKGTMKSFDITSDGTVNIDFIHGQFGNPLINAIEIINNSVTPPPNATTTRILGYNGTAITANTLAQTSNFDWTNVRGAVMVGRSLFYGSTDGFMYKRSFDGVSFGDPVQVNPYNDPVWMNVPTGSGPTSPVQTYNGVVPTWYSTSTTTGIAATTGMFYWNGRLYYTKSGSNSLFWRWFHPDAGIVGAIENTVTGGNITWSATKGMFVDGGNLYVVSSTDGSLLRIPFVNGAPSGTSTVVNSVATGGIDWRGRALFLASVLPNAAPTASFTYNCAGISCTFDGSGSTDSDGSIASYEWSFGDGEESGEAAPQHDFVGTGTYTVSLTVTDDQDASTTTTQQVSVVKPNVAPTASFTPTCDYLDCTFDSTSTDSDGTVDGFDWDFGDGTPHDTTSGAHASYTFAQPGTYNVTLVVTDNEGLSDDVTMVLTVVGAPAPSTVNFVASAVNQGNVTTPNATVPAGAVVGDRLIMILTLNANNRLMSAPTGVTGWTVLGTETTAGMASRIYTKVVESGDAGKKVTVPIDVASKYTMTIAEYSGVRNVVPPVTGAIETVSQLTHTSATVAAPAGAWVATYWSDKSTSTTGFALPGAVTSRSALCGTSTGHICSSLADSNGAAPTGTYAGLTATADSASANAAMWTVVLRTQEADIPPVAAFTQTCDSLTCTFDASSSSDQDGQVESYAWDFGASGADVGVSPTHTFPATGTYPVTLTVTDNEGMPSAPTTIDVSVTRTNTSPTAAYTFSCRYLVCSFDASGSSDPDGTVDTYTWDFGDNGSDSGAMPADHTYASAGSYQVTLTVTDNDGASTPITKTVSPVAVRPIAFVGANVNQGNVATPNANVPATTSAGDRLVMILSLNASNRVMSAPTGTTGWTLLDTAISGTMATTVYTKVAAAGDAGKKTTVVIDAASKYTMTIAAYSGDMTGVDFAKAAETTARADHTTPTVAADDGDIALSYWADKSSATTQFALPGGVTSRGAICGASTGHICSVLAESAGPVSTGPYGGLVATADSAAGNASMWTIVLRQDS